MRLQALLLAAALGLGAAFLASCETMSAEECAVADWAALGYGDASASGAHRLAARAESCARKGISANPSAYDEGFAHGMRAFCTPERGFAFARQGGAFDGACPADLAEDFSYAYTDGRRVHDAQAQIDSIRGRISSAESHRRQNEEDLHDRQRALDNAQSDEERARLRGEIDRLRRERRDISEDLRAANDQLPRALRLMDDVRAEIGGRYGPW